MTVALERRCENCQRILGPSRSDRRFCSTACRVAAYRRRQQPAAPPEPQPLSPEMERVLAEATREERLLALVAHAARTNWRAAAWILDRRWPERWGRQPRSRPVEVPPQSEGDDFFREIDELARKRRERLR
jgi:hypothetical protein